MTLPPDAAPYTDAQLAEAADRLTAAIERALLKPAFDELAETRLEVLVGQLLDRALNGERPALNLFLQLVLCSDLVVWPPPWQLGPEN